MCMPLWSIFILWSIKKSDVRLGRGGGYKLSDNSRQTLENLDFDQTPFMDAPFSSWYSKKNWSIFDIKSIAEYLIDQ